MHNKNKADIILAVTFILFIAAVVLKYFFGSAFIVNLIYFSLEAALVGGIADWFAITALFEKPLGFSWHTAIIPNNRDQLIEKVSEMVEDELLSSHSISAKVDDIDLFEILAGWLENINVPEYIEAAIEKSLNSIYGSLDSEKILSDTGSFLKDTVKKTEISLLLSKAIHQAMEKGNHRNWILWVSRKAYDIVKQPGTREKIHLLLKSLEQHDAVNSPGVNSRLVKMLFSLSKNSDYTNLSTVSRLIQKEILALLLELEKPGHPLFIKLEEKLKDLVESFENDQPLREALESCKNAIADRIEPVTLDALLTPALESESLKRLLTGFISERLLQYWKELRHDTEVRQWINGLLKTTLKKIISHEHYLIGAIVRETLEAFTNDRLNEFIRDKAGNDLQWIRINGSLVGGIAGMIIYIFINGVYDPMVVPFVLKLFTP